MPSKEAAKVKMKFVTILRACKYSHGEAVKAFVPGERLYIDPKLKDGFSTEKPFISEKFSLVLELNRHIKQED